MRPYNPFYYPFIINNSGNIKVVNIKYILLISKITTNSNNQINNVKFQDINTQYSINQIEAGGSNPIDITYAFGMNGPIIKSAQVFIKYDYLIPILKHHFTDSTKFVLFKDDNNQYTWIEYQN